MNNEPYTNLCYELCYQCNNTGIYPNFCSECGHPEEPCECYLCDGKGYREYPRWWYDSTFHSRIRDESRKFTNQLVKRFFDSEPFDFIGIQASK